jgi:hypothetical protein
LIYINYSSWTQKTQFESSHQPRSQAKQLQVERRAWGHFGKASAIAFFIAMANNPKECVAVENLIIIASRKAQ